MGACYTVINDDSGLRKCGLAFSFWESGGREGEAVRGWLAGRSRPQSRKSSKPTMTRVTFHPSRSELAKRPGVA
jgi:hypothetical protein